MATLQEASRARAGETMYPAWVFPLWNSRRSPSGPLSFRIACSRAPSFSVVQFST